MATAAVLAPLTHTSPLIVICRLLNVLSAALRVMYVMYVQGLGLGSHCGLLPLGKGSTIGTAGGGA